jgi:hypothetical protein
VVIATSYRGACNTSLPQGNTRIATTSAPCFEDQGFSTVNQLCNQGTTTQIVQCYPASGEWPNQTVTSGLHFIRGYPATTPGTGPPGLEGAHLEYVTCSYFWYHPNTDCQARLSVTLDLGDLQGDYPNPNPPPARIRAPLRASDVEVRFRLVREVDRGNNRSLCDFGPNCDLLPANPNGTGTVTFTTTGANVSPHLSLTAGSRRNAVAIQVRLRNAQNHSNPNCRNANFNNNCRWYYTGGDGVSGNTNEPNDAAILAAPVQRSFRSTSVDAGSIQWLRLTANDCQGGTTYIDNEAASRPSSSASCFIVDMGLKGGIARDADEPALLLDDGTGRSQVGVLDCDPNRSQNGTPQGQALRDNIIYGCDVWYGRHPFDWVPLCPDHNNLFTSPNPGAPWNDGRWPPLRCVKTAPTGQANPMERGFKERLFGNENQNSCPADRNDFVKGRNYWKVGTNMDTRWGYRDDDPQRDTLFHPADPRLVTIFLTTPEAFARRAPDQGAGQDTYPITGFISVYVTGFGKVRGGQGQSEPEIQIDDPCPGNTPPPDLDLSGGSAGGYVVWGHIINYVIPSPRATPSGRRCTPETSAQPCVATLVE